MEICCGNNEKPHISTEGYGLGWFFWDSRKSSKDANRMASIFCKRLNEEQERLSSVYADAKPRDTFK
jgi:hypothetical protein